MAKVKTEFDTQIETQAVKAVGEDEIFQQEVFEYLNELRESGVTNMFGAGPYIENAYGVDRAEAANLLNAWIEQF